MWASAIVKGQISADADAGLGYCLVGVEVDFLVFDRTPEPFNEHVVPPRTLAIHRDGDFRLLQHGREVHRGELRSLVSVEDIGVESPSRGGGWTVKWRGAEGGKSSRVRLRTGAEDGPASRAA